jgi:septum formation protein
VITAVAVAAGMRTHLAVQTSHVSFGVLPSETIERYIASGEPFGKAGAYAIQSAIAAWVERIDGSYSSIMGLPLYETAHLLRQARVRF